MNKSEVRIENLQQRRAVVDLRVSVGSSYRVRKPDGKAAANAPVATAKDAALMPLPQFDSIDQVTPDETDYIFPMFRALSATLIEGHWIDFTKPGVLEAATALLQSQTVYKNHWDWNCEDWIGVVLKSQWDAAGKDVGGVPGINVELKIDALKEPMIARGLLMEPPAIHSVSVKVFFIFEYSHPELAEKGMFWRMLGEEVDGQIVRMIVTEITGFGEISLVNRGADNYAKRLPKPDDDTPSAGDDVSSETEDDAGLSSQTTGVITVKLNAAQIAALQLTGQDGQDFPEVQVLTAVESLANRAALAAQMVEAARDECRRQAKLAAGVPDDGKLSIADELAITNASAEQLAELTQQYAAAAAEKFPQTCQKCGARALQGRSSVGTNEPGGPTTERELVDVSSIHG